MSLTTSRKVLVPLSTMLVAAAVAVGSGATFTSQSVSAAAVTSGTLKHANSQDGATLTIADLRPGATRTGSLTITNDGTIDSTLTLQETEDSSTFVPGDLTLSITRAGAGTPLYQGNFGGLDNGVRLALGSLPVGASTTVTFTVSMPESAGNANQGRSASATYQYVSTQVGGDSGAGSWLGR